MNQQDIFLIINKYKAKRPSAKRNLDQFWATNKTVFKRAQFLSKIDNIKNKKIIFLGDDDLTSIYFCLTGRAKEVLVIDIDERIIHYIQEVSKKENLKIKTKVWDLRNPLPKEFKDYDIAFFDPAYTPQGVTTWLKSCIEATLRSGKLNKKRKSPDVLTKKRYYLCYGYSDRSSERGLEIQKIITNFGLIIQEKIKGFNKYIGAQSIGSKSDLYILMPTPKVNIAKSDKITTNFYTGYKSQN
jgi:predicted methyltransferase